MKVLIADKMSPAVVPDLEGAGCTVYADPSLNGDALLAALTERDPAVLIVRSTKVLPEHLDAADGG